MAMTFDFVDGRHFENLYPDYTPDCKEIKGNRLAPELIVKFDAIIKDLVSFVSQNIYQIDKRDSSMHTGLSGAAYMYKLLDEHETCPLQKREWKIITTNVLNQARRVCCGRSPSFLNGDAGPLLTSLISGVGKPLELVDRLLRLENRAMKNKTSDEVTFGRAGYLYALLELRRYNIRLTDVEGTISRVVTKMIQSGIALSTAMKGKGPPLLYTWNGNFYLGAAHGMAGIMYILLQVPSNLMEVGVLDTLIRPTIDWMISLHFISGNFPPCWGVEAVVDKLVHWFHGAPGWVYMFTSAYEVFKDERHLAQAKVCGEVIWKRGLLRKGHGLCHGVPGNGYAFLRLYRLTGHVKYLYRAVKFAEFCCDRSIHECRESEKRFSFSEGVSGTVYFLKDIQFPQNARFPGFEL